jgi:outer membrane biosynthesis protein TonB
MNAQLPSLATRAAAIALLSATLVLAGCAGDSQDWRSAQAADTQEAYDAFLAKHPGSDFAAQAKERAAQLLEERDWETATQADTADSYTRFLTQHPKGKWAQEARVRVENFNVLGPESAVAPAPVVEPAAAPPAAGVKPAPAPQVAPAARPAVAPKPVDAPKPATAPKPAAAPKPAEAAAAVKPAAPAPVAKPAPVTQPAAAPKPAAAAPSNAVSHRIQLGAFSSRAKAESEWQRLRGKHVELKGLASNITEAKTAAGQLFRLQASVASEARAKELCASLKAAGQACLYVPPG